MSWSSNVERIAVGLGEQRSAIAIVAEGKGIYSGISRPRLGLDHESRGISMSDVLSQDKVICSHRPVSWFSHENKNNDRGNRGWFPGIRTELECWLG
jgi:hypothetical protein